MYWAIPENIYTHPKEGHRKFWKVLYEAKLEIPGSGGGGNSNQRNLPWVVDIFWKWLIIEQHNKYKPAAIKLINTHNS